MKFFLKILVFMGIILAGKITKEENAPAPVALPAPVSATPEEEHYKQHQQLQVLLRDQEQQEKKQKKQDLSQHYAF